MLAAHKSVTFVNKLAIYACVSTSTFHYGREENEGSTNTNRNLTPRSPFTDYRLRLVIGYYSATTRTAALAGAH